MVDQHGTNNGSMSRVLLGIILYERHVNVIHTYLQKNPPNFPGMLGEDEKIITEKCC